MVRLNIIVEVLETILGENVKAQAETAAVIVTEEYTLMGTAESAPIVPLNTAVLPAGYGLSTFPIKRVMPERMVPLGKIPLSVIIFPLKVHALGRNVPVLLI